MNNFSIVPHVSIEINGSELSTDIVHTIREIQVKQILSAPSLCEIILPEAHQDLSTHALSKIGGILNIKIENHQHPLFSGQITAIDYVYDASLRPLLVIRGYDLLHRLRKRQPVRTHIQVNLNQLAKELTGDQGIAVQGGEKTPLVPRLFQYRQSDLQLLHEFGENYGHYFFLKNDQLFITSLEDAPTGQSLTLGENLLEVRFSVNAETATDSITATSWNPQLTMPHIRTAQTSDIKVNPNSSIKVSDFDTNGQRTLVDCNAQDEDQVETVAQKELTLKLMQQATLWGVADGDSELTPGLAVKVAGVAESLEGRYVLTEVKHSIDPVKGYISEFNTTVPVLEKTQQSKNATLGVVSQVDDPENLGRIKVSLPTYNDIETEWLEVLSPGAGSKKGQLILPDVGDNVLLLIVNGEPAQSIILGGIYGEKDLPDQVIEEGAVKRFITKTNGNQQIILDDSEVSINIATESGHCIQMIPEQINITHNNGSVISLSEQRMTIHSETNLDIEAPGNSITIRGRTIDFEKT